MNIYKPEDGYECEECGADFVATAEFLHDDDSRWFCVDCLREALNLLESPWLPLDTAPLGEIRVLIALVPQELSERERQLPWNPVDVVIARFDRTMNTWIEDNGRFLRRTPMRWKPLPKVPR